MDIPEPAPNSAGSKSDDPPADRQPRGEYEASFAESRDDAIQRIRDCLRGNAKEPETVEGLDPENDEVLKKLYNDIVANATEYRTHMGKENPLCPRCETETNVAELEAEDGTVYVAFACPQCNLACPIGYYEE